MPENPLISGIVYLADQAAEHIRGHAESEILGVFNLKLEAVEREAVDSYLRDHNRRSWLIDVLRRDWHRRFKHSLELIHDRISQTEVLCAFGSLIDAVFSLNQVKLDVMEGWSLRPDRNEGPESDDPGVKLLRPSDLIAALSQAFRTKGNKPIADTPDLRSKLRDSFPLTADRLDLGGASATIAEALAQLGLDARVYAMYHSRQQAKLYSQGAKYVNLSSETPAYKPANECGNPSHPTRWTYGLAYSRGLTIRTNNVSATNIDRVLVRMMPFFSARRLQSFKVDGRPEKIPGEGGWPFVTGFVKWQLNAAKNKVTVQFHKNQAVRQLAQAHPLVILNSPGLRQLQNPSDPAVATLLGQLHCLAGNGSSLHLEISGKPDPTRDKIMPFARSLAGVVRSMGINDEDLAHIASLPDYPKDVPRQAPDSSPPIYRRYVDALRLASTLKLDRLYVHATDVDLVLRRQASEAAIQLELKACLFTKGAVVVSILLRNGVDPRQVQVPSVLSAEGFKDLIILAWWLAGERETRDRKARLALFDRIVKDGYLMAKGRDDYSVAITPVMWPREVEEVPGLNTTGAGDICSGIGVVYSGWR